MRKRAPLRMIAVFSIIVFIIISISMLVIGTTAGLLTHTGVIGEPDLLLFSATLGLLSIVFSTCIAMVLGKKVLAPISMINEATKEVAKGNFNIRLPEDPRAKEIREMARNFNIMTQELANIETFRSDFISNVSHEFKTPISAIEGYATLLQNTSLNEMERQEYVAKILVNARRLSSLSGNILKLSRLENEGIAPTKKSYSLDEQLREVILLYASQWGEKNIDLDVDLERVTFHGSEELIAQVWQNIIGNAVKFAPNEGKIRVILRQDENFVSVSITDNGIGMTDEVKSRVFEKFYQGDHSHSSEGNGLGLTLAKRIVDQCRGSISISSKVDKGTTFTVKLPKEK